MNRRGDTEIVIFGRRTVLDALATPAIEVAHVRVARGAPGDYRRDLAAACRTRGVECEVCELRRVHETSEEPRHDQGVAAFVRMTNISETEEFIAALTGPAAAQRAAILAVDGVTNPQNLGMIIRSAVAAGVTGFLWPTEGVPWINGLVVKSSAGTIFRCPIIRCDSLEESIWAFQGSGFQVCGLTGEAGESLFAHQPPHRAVYVLGSENEGLSDTMRGLIDVPLRIPMRNDVESLNVAVAAALVAFHVANA